MEQSHKGIDYLKLYLRLFIAIIVGIPTYPILLLTFSLMGIFFMIPLVGLFGIPFYWLLNDKDNLQDSKEMIYDGGALFAMPIMFWYYFTIGKNPFEELEF